LQRKGEFWQHKALYPRKHLTLLSPRDEDANLQSSRCKSNAAFLRTEIVDLLDLYT